MINQPGIVSRYVAKAGQQAMKNADKVANPAVKQLSKEEMAEKLIRDGASKFNPKEWERAHNVSSWFINPKSIMSDTSQAIENLQDKILSSKLACKLIAKFM